MLRQLHPEVFQLLSMLLLRFIDGASVIRSLMVSMSHTREDAFLIGTNCFFLLCHGAPPYIP